MVFSKSLNILIVIIFYSLGLCAQNSVGFRHVSAVVDNKVLNISNTTQDLLGNIWMVCYSGILVYDGYSFELTSNESIFSSKNIKEKVDNLVRDQEGNMWLLSNQGQVVRYNFKKGNYEEINESLLRGELITAIFNKGKSLWLASDKGSIYRFKDSKMELITKVAKISSSLNKIVDIEIRDTTGLYLSTADGKVFDYSLKSKEFSEVVGPFTGFPGKVRLHADEHNRLWIGTETYGLFVYDMETKSFIQDQFLNKERYSIDNELILDLFGDSKGNVWVGTDGGGLYRVDSNTGTIDRFTKNDFSEFSLSSNTILHISEDNHHNIWICTNYGRINVLPSNDNNIFYHPGSKDGKTHRVLSIYRTKGGTLWLGTDGDGITKIEFHQDSITKEFQYFKENGHEKGFYIQSIAEDERGNMWFGTYKNGLWHYDIKKDRFKKIKLYNVKKHEGTDVRTVFKDSKGRIWIGSNIQINVYSDAMELLACFDNNSHGLNGTIVESIYEDHNGVIWLGLYEGGLFNFNENLSDLSHSSFTDHSFDQHGNRINNAARSITQVTEEELLLIGQRGTLFQYNITNNTFINFEQLKNIPHQNFSAILMEDKDNIWLSSTGGISHLNLKNDSLTNYYAADGFQSDVFTLRSSFKDDENRLYFGGMRGVNYFNPEKLQKQTKEATLQIKEIEVLNQPAHVLIPDQVQSGNTNVRNLNLKNNQSSFSFKFSAIGDILNPKFHYAYRLKGFNKEWIDSRPERMATYTNIPPGNYTFEVKAGTKKGIWDIPVQQIAISIAPPFWNSWGAYIVYFIFLLFVGLSISRWLLLRRKYFFESVIHKKEKELNDLKMNFFTKMSHEIQTPITLILSPLDEMLSWAEKNGNLLLKERIEIISYNAQRLSKIARELTLVRNKELNRLRLTVTENNLYQDIENITGSFKELARKKRIDFVINCPKNLSGVWYDRQKIEHVVYNLLSNAFKFTPKEGNISLNIVPINDKKSIKLSVSDSGSGIPQGELENIFELFYQSQSGKTTQEGTGIGLALSKEIMDLHHGKIEVESTEVEGTVFTITLPITEDAYQDYERITSSLPQEAIAENGPMENSIEFENDMLDSKTKTVLLVEDNYDLQMFLKELLSKFYNVIVAENGEEGFYYAKSNLPDLILSDVMMPLLDGVEMCKRLQKDELTKHIPIVLLTAKYSTNAKILGLKSGAIEYINKPFNTGELLLKIQNIISSKENIIQKYRKEVISHPEVGLEKSQNELFLENLVTQIDKRMKDPHLKMEDLAESLNMGYSSLYRKCQSVTGKSLVEFVRLLRLKKAAILITKYEHTISEAACNTGFNDPKYLSKCFKNHFNKTPGKFKKEALEEGVEVYLKRYKLEDV
ncbi:response regulator [Arenibacter sp. 6A1]|uniref:two-component regulator propeller domain-containing protein n=1 Tax=Arenibacter sp. 6A1 TaxID=2720391 RepID=UPI001446CE99|nr:two-component regulator propeller domain-containing protein [Arenibacter sp. 6A1]NKI28453.1 response regulator [Arenibacter sp. 6A1]